LNATFMYCCWTVRGRAWHLSFGLFCNKIKGLYSCC
jgi:hypothetical protein